jgi:hypothetical protein
MNCTFCHQLTKKQHTQSAFWLCSLCKVFFKDDGSEIVFRPNSKTHWIWLYVKINEDKTEVRKQRDPKSLPIEDQMDMDPMAEPKLILSCKPAIKGVTPQNMHSKLKTLLTFS